MPTQAERRLATRRALLDAAAATLVDHGLVGFTTSAVASRAGLSNGALFRHFPTRLDLLVATVEDVLARLRAGYEERFTMSEAADRSPEALLDRLWESMADRELAAVFELYTRARTDPELLEALAPVVGAHGEHIRSLAERVNAGFSGLDPDVGAGLATLAILSMQGLVINNLAGTWPGTERDLIALLSIIYDGAIGAEAGGPPP